MKFKELVEEKIYSSCGNKYTIKNGGLYNLSYNDYSDYSMCAIMNMNFEEVKEFTEKELTVLNALLPKYEWIIKSQNGKFYVFTQEPLKTCGVWFANKEDMVNLSEFNLKFNCLSWEDKEATKWR